MTKEREREDKATAKNCSIKRECLNKRKGIFLTKTPHTANMLFSQKIVQKKRKKTEREGRRRRKFLCIHKTKNSFLFLNKLTC